MAVLTEDELILWLRKRRTTMIIFMLQSILIGMDYGLTFSTLWSYLNELIQPASPKIYYTVISVSFLFASIMFSGFIGTIADRSRNVRMICFTVNTLVIIGNLIYSLPFSAGLLIVGRFLSGIGGPLRSVMVGELARVYPADELPRKLSLMGMSYFFGYLLGPLFNLLFTDLRITVISWRITRVNAFGIYMAVFFFILLSSSTLMLSNLSQEYDLKEETKRQMDLEEEYSKMDCMENSALLEGKDKPKFIDCLKKMVSNYDVMLILVLSLFQSYYNGRDELWLSLMIIERIKWPPFAVNIVYVGMGVACLIPLSIVLVTKVTNKLMYYVAVTSQVAMVLIDGINLVFFEYNKDQILVICLWVIYSILYSILVLSEEIFLVSVIAQMVSSRYQVQADGIRLAFFRLGAVIALSTSALLFEYIKTVFPVTIGLAIICLFLLILRRKTLMNPRLVI